MSPKYDLVKSYYLRGLWSEKRVLSAICRWITESEAREILSIKAHETTVEEPESIQNDTIVEPELSKESE